MRPKPARISIQHTELFVNLLIISFSLWLRLTAPNSLPVFGDEGINIWWAQEFAQHNDQGYPLLMDGRYLFGVMLAVLGIYGPGPLRFGRAIVAVISTLGCAAAIALGKQLGSRSTGALSGLFYSLLPYAVFHDRQALTDPAMASVGALVLVFTLWAARPGRWGLALPTAAMLSAAFLYKPTGLIYGLAPLLAVFTLVTSVKERWRLIVHGLIVFVLTVILTGLFLWVLSPRLGLNDGNLINQRLGFLQCPPVLCKLDLAEQWRQLQVVGPPLPELLAVDYGWPLLGLAGLAWPMSAASKRRQTAFIFLFAAGTMAALVLASRHQLVARYLSPLAVPFVALGAYGLVALVRRASTLGKRLVMTGGLMLAVAAPLSNSLVLIAQPARARLPAFDRIQYFTGAVAGVGIQEAALAIYAREAAPYILTKHRMWPALATFFDPRYSYVLNPWEAHWADIEDYLRDGGNIYLIDEIRAEAVSANELPTDSLDFYPRENGASRLRVQRVSLTDPQSRTKIFNFVFSQPDEIFSDYQALAQVLASQPDEARLITYPPHQLALLSELLTNTYPIMPVAIGGEAPWEIDSTLASLAPVVTETDLLHVVFLDEIRLDPHKHIETWLNTHLYRLDEQWFGPLRLVDYAGEGEVMQTISVEAHLGDNIVLETVEILDDVTQPGGVVRLRLTWRAQATVRQKLKVFTHLFQELGIVAQHDGQPVGELRPTFTWQVGERIIDQFAIRLSSEATPGEYHLRIGLYDADTQARLPVQLSDGTQAEYYVGGKITIP